ncbi:ABC transporter ATP-binding protein [Paenibacillus methanolicus]|uniref:Putative ABC transport system ATP-binding protein n=1 Tax=Paenibacillus methanolicus TaxID=582686 RepID=A0A5S5C149_9BACL|nr:ABC transporter ATP-binding protein [Paenibacillus methanolicus]TYP73024.1 putative ABC transport system ATP-binding protein [Paenibacillus methanolicus]
MKNVIETTNVTKVYGAKGIVSTALEHIDLTVREGEFVGIMGPSGSGKSTLLNLLATIDQSTSGDIRIDGTDILGMSEKQLSTFRREKIGFIFQDYNLLDTLTVKENIWLPLALSRTPIGEMERRVDEIADKFGIRGILDKYPTQLSGGQKQRTAASRAIIARPRLILADEPTGALDSKSATDLLDSLQGLNRQDKATILMVTHDAYAASYCTRVLFLKDGRLFTELVKGDATRQAFFKKVLDVLNVFGGGVNDVI